MHTIFYLTPALPHTFSHLSHLSGQEFEARLSKTLIPLVTKEGVENCAKTLHPSASCVVTVLCGRGREGARDGVRSGGSAGYGGGGELCQDAAPLCLLRCQGGVWERAGRCEGWGEERRVSRVWGGWRAVPRRCRRGYNNSSDEVSGEQCGIMMPAHFCCCTSGACDM